MVAMNGDGWELKQTINTVQYFKRCDFHVSGLR